MFHSTGSHLMWMLEEFQLWFEEQGGDSKFSNSLVMDHCITPKFGEVFTRVQMQTDMPVLLRTSLALVAGTNRYMLPPNIHEVWQLVLLDDNGDIIADARPRNYMHSAGPGWRLEGREIVFEPSLTRNHSATLIYSPGADLNLHYSTSGQIIDSTTVQLGDPVADGLGRIDFRPNAYAGMTLRVLGMSTSAPVEERIIQTYDYSTGRVTFADALVGATGSDKIYEIVMPGTVAFYESIVLAAAIKYGAMRGVSGKNYQLMVAEYQSAIKSASDQLANVNVRISTHQAKNTWDSEGYEGNVVLAYPLERESG